MKKVFAVVTALLVLPALVVVVGTTLELIDLAFRLGPRTGQIAVVGISAIGIYVLAVPTIMLVRYKAATRDSSLAYAVAPGSAGHDRLRRMLTRDLAPHLDLPRGTVADMETLRATITRLDEQAMAGIMTTTKKTAAITALSQNGSLDALVLLSNCVSIVRRVVGVYQVRPSALQLLGVYKNVFLTVALSIAVDEVAGQVQDIAAEVTADAAEDTIEGVTETVLGKLSIGGVGAVPFIGPVLTTILSSLVDGLFNGLLVMRVGYVTMAYARPGPVVDRRAVKKQALAWSLGNLGSVAKAIVDPIKKKAMEVAKRNKKTSQEPSSVYPLLSAGSAGGIVPDLAVVASTYSSPLAEEVADEVFKKDEANEKAWISQFFGR